MIDDPLKSKLGAALRRVEVEIINKRGDHRELSAYRKGLRNAIRWALSDDQEIGVALDDFKPSDTPKRYQRDSDSYALGEVA